MSISLYQVAKVLQERGADVNACDEQGRSALHYACSKSSVLMVKWLAVKGADVNRVDR